MMTEQNGTESGDTRRGRKDRWVKIGFVVVAIGLGVFLYRGQVRDPELANWSTDFQEATGRAADAGTRLVVLFTTDPLGLYGKRMIEETLQHPKVQATLDDGGYATVHLTTSDHEEIAGRYGVESKDTPVLLLLEPDGTLVRRSDGFVTMHAFANDFLQIPLGGRDPNATEGAHPAP